MIALPMAIIGLIVALAVIILAPVHSDVAAAIWGGAVPLGAYAIGLIIEWRRLFGEGL